MEALTVVPGDMVLFPAWMQCMVREQSFRGVYFDVWIGQTPREDDAVEHQCAAPAGQYLHTPGSAHEHYFCL